MNLRSYLQSSAAAHSINWSGIGGLLAALLLFFWLAKPIFRDYFTRPNSLTYAYGGDALALYYNTAFHARYGEDSRLQATNYPHGEYIYLTDAQGILSNVLRVLRQMGFDVSDCAVGIVNGMPLYLLFAAVAVVYGLLLALGGLPLPSAVFAPLIVLLSPQIIRMHGHFGLAYPVAIPLAMLWFVRKYRVRSWEKRDVLFLLVALLFTYNNPYVGLNMNLLLVGAGLIVLLRHRFERSYWMPGFGAALMGAGALLWVFLDFLRHDPVSDRVSPQWGFFYYHARFEGFFYPPGSLLHGLLQEAGIRVPAEMEFEALVNVGLVATTALVVGLLVLPFSQHARQFFKVEHTALVEVSILLAILAANTALLPISQRWIEDNLPWLLMFKASGRLGWPLYFALTVTGALIVDALYRTVSPLWARIFFLLIVAAIWRVEIDRYIAPRFREAFQENIFDARHEAELLSVLRENHIEPSEFQAILALPRFVVWSDKVRPDLPFEAQFWSMRLALATGLPIVNSVLSRVGTQHALERVQLFGHPLIERALLDQLPNRKDLLLLCGLGGETLQPGEQYLLRISEPLAQTPRYALRRLRLDSLTPSAAIRAAQQLYASGYRQAPTLRLGFDETPTEVAFYGQGCHQTTPTEEWLCTFPRAPFDRDTSVVFSAWNYIDAGRWSPGLWLISVRDADGKELYRETLESRQSNDVQGRYWFRVQRDILIPRGGSVAIAACSDSPMRIDELMIWGKGEAPLIDDPQAEGFLLENVWVRKPKH